MFNKIKLLNSIKKEYHQLGNTNKSFRIEIKREDHPNLKIDDIESLIHKGYLWCDEENGKKITLDGNWTVVCRTTDKTFHYVSIKAWELFRIFIDLGGIIAWIQFIQTFIN